MTNHSNYRSLLAIADSIATSRLNINIDTPEYAFLLQCELIIRFLLLVCWRGKTIRSCNVASPNPNVFMACLNTSKVGTPAWVTKALEADSETRFWQYRFAALNHPGLIEGFIPQQLVPMLEEFVKNQRPKLLSKGVDPGTLFVAQDGKPFSQNGLQRLIGNITTRHFGRHLRIHDLRAAVQIEWLRNLPGGFQTLARAMSNSSVMSTVRAYLRFLP